MSEHNVVQDQIQGLVNAVASNIWSTAPDAKTGKHRAKAFRENMKHLKEQTLSFPMDGITIILRTRFHRVVLMNELEYLLENVLWPKEMQFTAARALLELLREEEKKK